MEKCILCAEREHFLLCFFHSRSSLREAKQREKTQRKKRAQKLHEIFLHFSNALFCIFFLKEKDNLKSLFLHFDYFIINQKFLKYFLYFEKFFLEE
jgi:hypothetical protein